MCKIVDWINPTGCEINQTISWIAIENVWWKFTSAVGVAPLGAQWNGVGTLRQPSTQCPMKMQHLTSPNLWISSQDDVAVIRSAFLN